MTGLGRWTDRLHHAATLREHRLVSLTAGVGPEFLEVVAGAERRTAPGDDHGAHGAIPGEAVELSLKRGEQGGGQAVACARAVERQRGDAAGIVAQEHGLAGVGRGAESGAGHGGHEHLPRNPTP